jgi:alanine racemase
VTVPGGSSATPGEARAGRPTVAVVDLDAIAGNVAALVAHVAPAALWAVVKADGYGHGAVPVARTALRAGAAGLCVALVEEGAALRAAGIEAPVLVLSEPHPSAFAEAVRLGLTLTVDRGSSLAALAGTGARVHLKLDTGMHRVGAPPDDAVTLARAAIDAGCRLEGVFSHLATADDPDCPFPAEQEARFDAALAALTAAGIEVPLVHLANSAGAIRLASTRRSLVRCGIAVYGLAPAPAMEGAVAALGLRPALSLHSRVSALRIVRAGAGVSYGLRWRAPVDTVVATVPIGYADGVPRRLSATGGEVLVGGRRRPIVGVVTMDQLMVACGPAGAGTPVAGSDPVAVGDEVVLLGAQGDERIGAEEWAQRLGTIAYEIVCGIGARVPRSYRGGGA